MVRVKGFGFRTQGFRVLLHELLSKPEYGTVDSGHGGPSCSFV